MTTRPPTPSFDPSSPPNVLVLYGDDLWILAEWIAATAADRLMEVLAEEHHITFQEDHLGNFRPQIKLPENDLVVDDESTYSSNGDAVA